MELIEQLKAGNRRALARAISTVEDGGREAQAALAALYPHSGRARVIGITGAPGTGKSTLVNALARAYRVTDRTVGIIAIDPTSPFSGGALLGDRVRMRDLAGDAGVFIRSMATRGSLGGLARATADIILVLDAAGFERILVETVGVGQAEVDIASAAHTTIVVEAPGLGDEVQAIKAGVLEIADVFAVNKADREGADHSVMALRMMQGLAPGTVHHGAGHHGTQRTHKHAEAGAQEDGSWLPPIVKTVATRGEGVEPLREWIEKHGTYLDQTGQLAHRETARSQTAFERILCDRLKASLLSQLAHGEMSGLVETIASRRVDPYTAADELLAQHGFAFAN